MKDLGYGKAYRYAHDDPSHFMAQEYLPDELRGTRFYEPVAWATKSASRNGWPGGAPGRKDEGAGGSGEDS